MSVKRIRNGQGFDFWCDYGCPTNEFYGNRATKREAEKFVVDHNARVHPAPACKGHDIGNDTTRYCHGFGGACDKPAQGAVTR
jgi:hypothetical protein